VRDGVVKFARARAHRVHEPNQHVTEIRTADWNAETRTTTTRNIGYDVAVKLTSGHNQTE
jgi:hypothetical protein